MDKKTWHAHIKKQKLKINMALFRKKTKKKTSGTNWCYFPVSDAYLACTTDFEKCGKVVCTQTTGKKSIAKYPDSEKFYCKTTSGCTQLFKRCIRW